jgi:lysophospholipase L1-like esterase
LIVRGSGSGRLTAYGHSWVGGAGATREDRGFVEVAARGLGMRPDNRGVGGSLSTDTSDGLTREPAPASECYVVMTGLNDARLYGLGHGAIEAYAAALESIFVALASATSGASTIAVEQPPLLDYSGYEPHNRGSNDVLDAYNRQLREVASRFPAVHLATVTGWDATTMLDEDNVHPNDRGHAAVAAAVVAVAKIGKA